MRRNETAPINSTEDSLSPIRPAQDRHLHMRPAQSGVASCMLAQPQTAFAPNAAMICGGRPTPQATTLPKRRSRARNSHGWPEPIMWHGAQEGGRRRADRAFSRRLNVPDFGRCNTLSGIEPHNLFQGVGYRWGYQEYPHAHSFHLIKHLTGKIESLHHANRIYRLRGNRILLG